MGTTRKTKIAVAASVLFLTSTGALAVAGDQSIKQFFVMLASAGGLGIVSSVALTLIKLVFVGLENEYAVLGSVFAATVISMLARAALPFVENIPIEVALYWPPLVWLAQQIWYVVTKAEPDKIVLGPPFDTR